MSQLAHLLTRTVSIQTGTVSTDRYNNQTIDWSSPSTANAKAWIAQTSATEDQIQRDAQVTEATAHFDTTVQISATNRVVADGITYEVVGTPHVAYTPRGPHHLEVRLRAVLG